MLPGFARKGLEEKSFTDRLAQCTFSGAKNYNYETRPRFPFMRWKPVSPVYPRLIKRVPEGLTLEKATEMRQKGRDLMPICKLGRLF